MYEQPLMGPPPEKRSRTWIVWLIVVVAAVAAAAALVAVIVVVVHPGSPHAAGAAPASSPSTAATGSSGGSTCDWRSGGGTTDRKVSLPAAGVTASTATLHTNLGDVTISLERAAAPCTVASFASLAKQSFYNDSRCHRLTTPAAGLAVLQCGDPTGTGSGGPGYTIPDENLPTGKAMPYPRGTVAMANTGEPHTGGSQFFINYANNKIPASYAVFGTITGGMSIVDAVARAGVNGGGNDGTPRQTIVIQSVTVS